MIMLKLPYNVTIINLCNEKGNNLKTIRDGKAEKKVKIYQIYLYNIQDLSHSNNFEKKSSNLQSEKFCWNNDATSNSTSK